MTETEALGILERMTDTEFQDFLSALPARTTLILRAGMADWRKVLPAWYVNEAIRNKEGQENGKEDQEGTMHRLRNAQGSGL